MRIFSLPCALSALLALAFVPSARAADLVDNPAYTSWAAHKPGTTVSFQQEMAVGGMNMTHEITETLKEVTPDKATVEYKIVMPATPYLRFPQTDWYTN